MPLSGINNPSHEKVQLFLNFSFRMKLAYAHFPSIQEGSGWQGGAYLELVWTATGSGAAAACF
jgi:hypothetical protein